MDKDPKPEGRSLSAGHWGSVAAVAAAITLAKYDKLPPINALDVAGFVVLGLMLFWFSRARGKNAAGHESATQGIAFRFGKTLKGVWRRKGV